MKKDNNISESDHKRFWAVVEKIARDKGISVSRLAVLAGKDATTFNKSKRIDNGYYRLPFFATVMAILRACNLTWHDWARYWDSME